MVDERRRPVEGVEMNDPVITVIMLTYNRESLVSRAIDSVLGQTFHDFEFIIVDNGSTDHSGVIADGYAARDGRIRVIHRGRGNIGSGRNTGMDAARGEYIAFIDDDDWCEPDFLAFLYSLATENGADVAICGATKWEGGASSPVGVPDKLIAMDAVTAIIELLWRKRYNNGFPTKLFRRSSSGETRFPETGRYDDIYLMYKIFANADTVVSYGLPKYNVLRHDHNNSAATTRHGMITAAYLDDYRSVYRERADWLCGRFPANADYWRYFDWSFQISMIEKIVKYKLPDCAAHLSDMRRELVEHRDEFVSSPYILDFEKEWMARYL
jgi:glycosyltransferase involved in cell wall biosynthesis